MTLVATVGDEVNYDHVPGTCMVRRRCDVIKGVFLQDSRGRNLRPRHVLCSAVPRHLLHIGARDCCVAVALD